MSENAISGPLDIVRSMSGHWAVAQKAIYLPLEISQSMHGHCAISQNAQNALFWPL